MKAGQKDGKSRTVPERIQDKLRRSIPDSRTGLIVGYFFSRRGDSRYQPEIAFRLPRVLPSLFSLDAFSIASVGGRVVIESKKMGPIRTLPAILGVALMVVGLAVAVYGLALFGDRSSADPSTSPYRDFLLTYTPEFTMFSAACIFSLGFLLLYRATEKR